MNTSAPQLIEAPATDDSRTYETLGYADAYDAVFNGDHAFVAYKETDRSSGQWRVSIRSKHTAGASFEPTTIRSKAREADAQGKPYFLWGYHLDPSAHDPRQIEFRVHVASGQPKEIEIFVVMRKFDRVADAPKSVRFAWPRD